MKSLRTKIKVYVLLKFYIKFKNPILKLNKIQTLRINKIL